jgi:kumamolisin
MGLRFNASHWTSASFDAMGAGEGKGGIRASNTREVRGMADTVKMPRSFRHKPRAERVADVEDDKTVHLTVVLKPGSPLQPEMHAGGSGITRAEYAARYGTPRDVMDRVIEYATSHGLRVEEADAARHIVKLAGTYAQARSAFQPEDLGVYRAAGRDFVARGGDISVPADLADHIVAVMGFDERAAARPQFRIQPRAAAMTSYDPAEIARYYTFPSNGDGAGQTIALIELGGGYDPKDVAQYFAAQNVKRSGSLESVSVDGATNAPEGNPHGPDAEVQLDIDIAGSVAPGANIAVYFGPNRASGFLDAVQAAVHDQQRSPSVVSISWGNPESAWPAQDMDAMDQAFQAAAAMNVTVCVASGDQGAVDGSADGKKTTDFPASSPNALGCGGTSLPRDGTETTWNNHDGWATGGGFSAQFPKPAYQQGISGPGRGVPDVAGNADGQTGYNIRVDGQDMVSGGTSAVAPLWAGLIALINQQLGKNCGFIHPVLYAEPAAMKDITTGDNDGYKAGPGWDAATGLGSPNGTAVLAALQRGKAPTS